MVGFPLGATSTESKAAETAIAVRDGAQEIDMVINVGALKSGDQDAVKADIAAVVRASHPAGAIVKVILETALLDDTQKTVACNLAQSGGRGFRQDLHRIRPLGRHRARCRADAPDGGTGNGREGVRRHPHAGGSGSMTAAGATRIGASASVKIVEATAA